MLKGAFVIGYGLKEKSLTFLVKVDQGAIKLYIIYILMLFEISSCNGKLLIIEHLHISYNASALG